MAAPSFRAELAAMLARELVDFAKRRAAELGGDSPVIGVGLAAALVYYARESNLADPAILGVVVHAMAEVERQRIGPVNVAPSTPKADA
jgi:hypothetical protein